jgi:hypothetical protein
LSTFFIAVARIRGSTVTDSSPDFPREAPSLPPDSISKRE